jgi:penicillin-binding protein 1A
VSSVLTQVIDRGTGTAAKLDRPAAGKTGTGQDYTDAWFCGYTPDLATAVWVGFPQDDQTMMTPPRTRITVYGGTWPAQIWHQTMSAALSTRTPRAFVGPTTTTTSTVPVPTTAPAPRPPVIVPNVVGMTADAGTTVAQQAGLSVARAPVVGTGQPPGTIVGQSPGSGASAPAGSTMTIEVEAGPDGAAPVPSVVGMDTASATHTLQAAGFAVSARNDVPPDGDPPPSGTVWKQSPVAGTVAAKGSVVTLTASP